MQKARESGQPGVAMKVKDLFWILLAGGAALFVYDRFQSRTEIEPVPQVRAAPVAAVPAVEDRSWIKPRDDAPVAAAAAATSPQCDGRTHCPQMRSCAEATYFIQHCPNTQMDGDGDGVPCEDQWCRF